MSAVSRKVSERCPRSPRSPSPLRTVLTPPTHRTSCAHAQRKWRTAMAVKPAPPLHTRLAGVLLLASIVVLTAWRLVIVEAILGPVNPADDLPGPERDLLASGLLVGSIFATIGFSLLARQLRRTSAGRWAQIGQYTCQAAPVILALGMLG